MSIDLRKKPSYCMMAFGKTAESNGGGDPVKRCVGVGTVSVLAVNPSSMELGKLYGRQQDKEPEYVGSYDAGGREVSYARVEFIVKADPEDNGGVGMTTKLGFFLRKEFRLTKERAKTQVIDRYGQTAWVTQEELKSHAIPVYSDGKQASLDKDYRPCYGGEEALTGFIRTYLGITERRFLEPGRDPKECECRLDKVDRCFAGDFTEIRDAIALRPGNKVKALFGVRESGDGREYQDFYDRMFLRPFQANYSRLERDLKRSLEAGAYPNVTFEVCPLKEYVVQATDLSKPAELPFGDPFGETAAAANPWDNGDAPF